MTDTFVHSETDQNPIKQSDYPFIKEIYQSLLGRFGWNDLGNKQDPVEEIFYIILSSRTPPRRYQNSFKSIEDRFGSYSVLADADPSDVANVIFGGGLQEKKGKEIVEIAKSIKLSFGRVTLSPLMAMDTDEAERYLLTLPGVGIKTARCVLMYAFDRPVFPVDVHCFRIAKRLGWIGEKQRLTRKVADIIQKGIPRNYRKGLHVGMILLGREYCHPRNPECEKCPIINHCPTGQSRYKRTKRQFPGK